MQTKAHPSLLHRTFVSKLHKDAALPSLPCAGTSSKEWEMGAGPTQSPTLAGSKWPPRVQNQLKDCVLSLLVLLFVSVHTSFLAIFLPTNGTTVRELNN